MSADEPTIELALKETARAPASDAPNVVLPEGRVEAPEFAKRYEERGLLGEGGMGSVRLCADAQIGRAVALKVIRADQRGSARAVSRFLREARVQGQLEHPAVVPVYDLGVDPEGSVFFTMKRVRGETLEEILERRDDGTSRHKLLSAFARVCLAVDFAHRRGVVHRDLKPANIMLGDYGEIYVLDWGLAKLTAHPELDDEPEARVELEASTLETLPGSILGTPGYMAPEQLRTASAVTPAADVYALGAIVFELLTRTPLHDRGSMATLIASTLDGAEARPSVRAPELDVAPELEAICVGATALDPADRFESARALHDALERYLEGERDSELRRQMADVHAERALSAERRQAAGEATLSERRTAMREVGRALALDPQNQTALDAMMRMLTTPPKEMPPEVRAEMKLSSYEQRRVTARFGALAYASMLLYLPIFFWIGVRDATPLVVFTIAAILTSAVSLWVSRHRRPPVGGVIAAMVLSNVAFAATATFYGPLILLPPIVVANTTGFAIHLDGAQRWLAMFVGAAVIVIPTLLEATGVIATSSSFHGGDTMVLHAGALELHALPTSVFLALVAVGAVLTSSLTVGGVRNQLREAEERLYLYTWHLREIVPEAARPSTDPTRARRTNPPPAG